MPDDWDLLPETERTADTVTNFIIFCEGDVTEPAYFEGFQKQGKLKVNALPGQKQGSRHLDNALRYCLDKGMVDVTEGFYKLKEPVTEHMWCVYDRDLENENPALINPVHNIGFTNSVGVALAAGFKVAWSNDAFELWILLHFEDVPSGQKLHRNYIYKRLTQVFTSLPNPSAELVKKISHPSFDYKETMKSRANFLLFVKPLLESWRDEAIKRAKALELEYSDNVAFHDRNPCTMVHCLVESLLSFQ